MYDQMKNVEQRELDLILLPQERDMAYAKIQKYKRQAEKLYNKKVKTITFQVRDLVFKKYEASKHNGKLEPNWEGPFKVVKLAKNRVYNLQKLSGKDTYDHGIHKISKSSTLNCTIRTLL
ncbi:UNVERIFIED_CONTAM: hypothetical protein Sradi_5710800 [Sesamum radiatum]|uniref:Reverse transcriptase domain-containing protein n=1 Tax=Sesamum radiatum TaxID=300843 RepID=A0AAW2L1J9_SESRA